MNTQEQATFIGQELKRKLSFLKDYSVLYDTITDGEIFYVDVVPTDGQHSISSVAMEIIIAVVGKYHKTYFITGTNNGKPQISIY